MVPLYFVLSHDPLTPNMIRIAFCLTLCNSVLHKTMLSKDCVDLCDYLSFEISVKLITSCISSKAIINNASFAKDFC